MRRALIIAPVGGRAIKRLAIRLIAVLTAAGMPAAGRIANGAIVEKETGLKLASLTSLKLSLHNPDLTTASRIAKAVNAYLGGNLAAASDPSNIQLAVPTNYPGGVMALLTDI